MALSVGSGATELRAATTAASGTPKADVDARSVAKGFSLSVLRFKIAPVKAPRAVVDTAIGVFVLDFGGWVQNRGRLVRMTRGGAGVEVVFKGLDRPHGMAVGPDGLIYVGESSRIFRFDPKNPTATRKIVVTLPPKPGEWKHPLTQFAWLKDGTMIVNNGSRTNNCGSDRSKVCTEVGGQLPAASLLRVMPGGARASGVLATGLRNSMGIVVHASGTIVQAENSRDSIDEADPSLSDSQLPHDELNVIAPGANYGWPYCFDDQRNSPEFPTFACSAKTQRPTVLLPAHSAPLGLAYWTPRGGREVLVVALHGYRDTGHRLMAFNVDPSGRPVGDPTELVRWAGDGESVDEIPGPVGISVARDGALLIADDRRGKILELRPV